ncbi:hypothetical protein KC957_04000, partial [Candidatus Saccharibacteria bacterium]|nr:hypothetical protein [Candidatus Saccharibacteria bacterium]
NFQVLPDQYDTSPSTTAPTVKMGAIVANRTKGAATIHGTENPHRSGRGFFVCGHEEVNS